MSIYDMINSYFTNGNPEGSRWRKPLVEAVNSNTISTTVSEVAATAVVKIPEELYLWKLACHLLTLSCLVDKFVIDNKRASSSDSATHIFLGIAKPDNNTIN